MERGSATRVLVVEDEVLARGALRLILEQDGYEVRSVSSGRRAIKVLDMFDPNVIVMDWQVPGLSGERLFREIRTKKPHVPVIVVSSADEAFSTEMDVRARFHKPLDVPRFRAAIAASRAR